MSKSSKKLLITGGCSYTDENFKQYIDNAVTLWPRIVAKELDVDLINLGKAGASNEYITNSVIDTVMDNQDKDITVMVLWSSPNRINLFDLNQIVFPMSSDISRVHDPYQLIEKFKVLLDSTIEDIFVFDEKILNYNLRCMWLLNNFLELRSINFYQANAHSAFSNIFQMHSSILDNSKDLQKEREKRLIDNTPYNRYFSEKYFTTQSWRQNMPWLSDPKMKINGNGHPNQEAQIWLSDTFLIQTESGLLQSTGSKEAVDFIYD